MNEENKLLMSVYQEAAIRRAVRRDERQVRLQRQIALEIQNHSPILTVGDENACVENLDPLPKMLQACETPPPLLADALLASQCLPLLEPHVELPRRPVGQCPFGCLPE